MIGELTGLPLTNASLLDEATAAAEAVHMLYQLRSPQQIAAGADTLLVDKAIFSSIQAVLESRCAGLGIQLEMGSYANFTPSKAHFAALIA
jgi:glycine dehydrogenase